MLKNYLINCNNLQKKLGIVKTILVIKRLSLRVINLLLGFFLATVFSTLPGQTGDSTIIGASIIVSFIEYLSQYIYAQDQVYFFNPKYYLAINDLKIGIIYGLFVDSFKLGS